MTLQVLLHSSEGRRPLSALIEVESLAEYRANKDAYHTKAIVKIMANKGLCVSELRRYGYNAIQVRVYNRERIAQREADHYSQQIRGHIIQ
jgi:hypothetical protein